jgi:hypothetical protein
MPNNFTQQPQGSQIFTPNIQVAPSFVNSSIWNANGNEAVARTYTTLQTSNIFNQPMPGQQQQNITPNVNANPEPMLNSSSFIDLDALNNLSGDLQQLSFSDFQMDSFSKTGERLQNGANK